MAEPLRILLVGRNGQVGSELVGALGGLGAVTATSRSELDLRDRDAIVRAVRELRPELIVNAAAYTDVDRAESEPDEALDANAHAPELLAREAARARAVLVHYSTDYVFDGEKDGPYTEEDPPSPINVYGRSKLLGEEGVRRSGAAHLILRVAWVYGARRRNFLTTMLDLFQRRSELSVVDDQIGSPTWAHEIASATAELIERLAREGSAGAGEGRVREAPDAQSLLAAVCEGGGTYHLGGSDHTSWLGFAEEIARHLREERAGDLRLERLEAISADDWDSAARRPRNSRLDGSLLESRFGIALRPWREQLADCLARMQERRAVLIG